ncbi:centrosomal protein of 162 kDa isoform X2 [Engraulis encrasicolus]|uniref:centrosomal protein of 162 kDa isoform X2 n=1 Tax=Engraulis encrasicolus TaxID=184585 RepID=UPI002FD6EC62
MSRRLTKEELDLQFEQFLKESVSDDSVEFGGGPKRPSVLDSLGKTPPPRVERQKTPPTTRPWWQDDDDDELGSLLGSGRSFRKSLRKTQPIHEEEEEEQRPRRRAAEEEEEGQGDADRSALGMGFISRDSLEPDDSVLASGPIDAVVRSGLDTLEEEEEERRRFFARLEGGANSTIDYSRLNRELDSTGSTLTTLPRRTALPEETKVEVEEEEEKEKESKPPDAQKASPGGSGDYSDDFDEDEASQGAKKSPELTPDRPGMLAKVSLHDSFNSGDEAVHPAEHSENSSRNEEEEEEEEEMEEKKEEVVKEDNKPAGKEDEEEEHAAEAPAGVSYGQSGASEVEALQEAYKQLSHLEESEVKDQSSLVGPLGGGTGNTLSSLMPPLTSTLKPVSTTESDLPTAEELMRPIGPDSSFTRGFSLQPVSEVELQAEETEMREERSSAGRGLLEEEKEKQKFEERSVSVTQHSSSIAEEVRRLLKEQGEAQGEETSPQPARVSRTKAKKRQPAWRPTIFAPTSSSLRKAQTPPPQPTPADSRPAQSLSQSQSQCTAGRSGPTAKTPSPLARRRQPNQEHPPSRIPTLAPQDHQPSRRPIVSQTVTIRAAESEASLRVSSDVMASVQSFAAFLQQQMEESINSCNQGGSLNTDTPHTPSKGPKQPPGEVLEGAGAGAAEQVVGAPSGALAPPKDGGEEAERLRLQLEQRGREAQRTEEELGRQIRALKQENYLLQSQLHRAEEACDGGLGGAGDPVTEEKLQQLQKDIREQETLLQGYQQENEKLYVQVKALKAQSKRSEEAMFTENQRLLHELAITRDKLSRSSVQRGAGVGSTSEPGYSVSELLVQVKGLERTEARLLEEARALRQEKQALEVDLDVMKKERDLAKLQTLNTSGELAYELKVVEQRHEEEVCGLRRRLQWYSENQELLDKDSGRLKAANAEISSLQEQVKSLMSQVETKACQQARKAKERAADAKRIMDLERQVKEMEEILRRRHPNSLPALMYAAAAASAAEEEKKDDEEEGERTTTTIPSQRQGVRSPSANPPHSTILLQRRVQRLEAELESRDEDAKRSLRALEQQFYTVKFKYEERIAELQRQLSETCQSPRKTGRPQEGGLEEGEDDKDQPEEEEEEGGAVLVASARSPQKGQKKTVGQKAESQSHDAALQTELASLRQQLSKLQQQHYGSNGAPLAPRSPGGAITQRSVRQAEEAMQQRVERLTAELNAKSRSLQELTRTVERLQRERRTMLSGHWGPPGVKGQDSGFRGHEEKAKGKSCAIGTSTTTTTTSAAAAAAAANKGTMTSLESFPATQDEKAYQPAEFAESHISEVLEERAALQERLAKIEEETRREMEELRRAASHAQAELQRVMDQSGQQLAAVSASHQRELEGLRAHHALEHSTSKVAELANQLRSQEIVVRHLRDQVKDLQLTKEALNVSKLREDTLQTQLTRLLEELKQAKDAHTPELRHFTSLERKILNMERRYAEREKELQQVMEETRVAARAEQEGELERWRRLAQSRGREVDAFRLELDAILDTLRELQRQGVVIPPPQQDTRIPWGR